MSTDQRWIGTGMDPEPPAHVRRLRALYGYEMVRGDGGCDYDGCSLWQWERLDGTKSEWECWLEVDSVGLLVEVPVAT